MTSNTNLLRETNWTADLLSSMATGNTASYGAWKRETNGRAELQEDGLVKVWSGASSSGRYGLYQDVAVEAGSDMVLSMDHDAELPLHAAVGKAASWPAEVSLDRSGARAVHKFNTGTMTAVRVYLFGNVSGSAESYANRIKLEYGAEATEWTPSPFDEGVTGMIKAAAEVTVTDETDILSLVTWYALTSSATAPSAPSTTLTSQTPASPWSAAEPSFDPSQGTRYLYTCIQTRWKDGSCTWDNAVQLSSAYEQAKQAWNKANAARDAVDGSRSWYAECATAAATTAKEATIAPATTAFALEAGKVVFVKFANTNSGAVASLTLNVNETGAKPVKYIYNGSLSNIPAAGYLKANQMYQFSYDGTNWVVELNYNTNTDTVYTKYADSVVAGKNGINRYTLCMKDDEGRWTSIVNQANNANKTGKTAYAGGLEFGAGVVYATSGSDYAVGANSGVLYDSQIADLRYSANGITNAAATTELQVRKPFYLVGTIEDDGLFYLDQAKWWAQALPADDDGNAYLYVGEVPGSYYQAHLQVTNTTYVWHDGAFKAYEQMLADEAQASAEAAQENVETLAEAIGAVQEESRDAVAALRAAIEGNSGLAATVARIAGSLADLASFIQTDTSGATPLLLLGSSESDVMVAVTNNAVEFRLKGDDKPFTYLAGDESGGGVLYVQNTVVVNDLRFGDGRWAWAARENGNICLKYVEGSS